MTCGNRPFHFIPVLLLLGILLAGCVDPSTNGDRLAPSSLTAPAWSIGDHWNYVGSDGKWENWTVDGIEHRNGYDTYRVRVEYGGSGWENPFRITGATVWIDQDSLGWVAQRESDGFGGDMHPPMGQIFPAINRTYDVTIEWSQHFPSETHHYVSVVTGWQQVEAASTTLDVIELRLQDEADNSTQHLWYSPDVRNLVRYGTDPTFQLISWHRAEA